MTLQPAFRRPWLLAVLLPGWLAVGWGAQALPAQASPDGAALVAELGCGGCHEGLPAPEPARDRAPVLGGSAAALPMAFVYEYLEDPRPRREGLGATRMPDFRLSSRERLALALAIGSDGAGMEEVRGDYPEVDADDGRLLFSVLGCAGCHGGLGTGEEVLGGVGIGPSLEGTGSRLQGGWLRSFLEDPVEVRPSGHAPGTGSRMPDFRLAADEVDRILAYLQERRLDEGESGAAERALPALSPWGRARAEGYLTDRLSCLGCHSWRGEGGRVGPSLDGIVRRLTPEEVVRVVLDPGAARPGTVMPPSPFAPRILDQVAALLVGDSAAWAPPTPPEIPWEERMALARSWDRSEAGSVEGSEDGSVSGSGSRSGAVLYGQRCAQCHGSQGGGGGFNAAYLPVAPTAHADASLMARWPDDTLYDGIAAGGWVLDRSHRMPAFGGSLAREQVEALVAYIRELCGCEPPTWSRGGRP